VCAALLGCAAPPPPEGEGSRMFANPQRVTLRGYSGHAMEPFVSRDGRYLLFNNLNDPSENTNLHYAERIDDLSFQYRGEVQGVNTAALEGVPTMDRAGRLYFVSTRSYEQSFSTVYQGSFAPGRVSGVALAPGVSRRQPGMVNFDVEVSPDGATLYVVDSRFRGHQQQTADLFIAERRGDGWVRAAHSDSVLQHVNSDALEYAACISADGLTLFFTRAAKGLTRPPQIYVSQRPDARAPFGKPQRLLAAEGFVEAATLSPDERSLYYHKREGRKFVLYRVARQ
jgi:hypothetical protein